MEQPEHLMRPTDDLTAKERRELIASMRPSDAEGVPELHEVEIPDELREQIESAMSRYPQLRSASIPALWAVQRRYGWCTPEGIRQAAAVMGVTPAYLQSVASFYDLFRTTPIGRHQVLVCTNISCWMNGADELLGKFCEAAGVDREKAGPRRRQLRGRRALRQRLRVPRRLRHRADGLDRRGLLRPARRRRRRRRDRGPALRARRRAAREAALEAPGRRRPEMPDDPRVAARTPTAAEAKRSSRQAVVRRMPETRVLFQDIDDPELRTIDGYRRHGGYRAIERAFREIEPDELLKEIEESGLRGRGGAGFSMGKKGSFLPRGEMEKYLCCNADESEPGTFKDRELMLKNPHLLIEGVAIAALAVDATYAFIFIRGEYWEVADVLDRAVEEAYAAGYLGQNVLGTGQRIEVVVHRGAGAYICGEETALLDSLEGKRGNPRLKPPFPAIQGLYGGPTLINNVETLMNVPLIVNHGADWYREFGTEQSTGTKVVSVSGCVDAARQLRDRARDPVARDHLRPRRRPAGRAPGQGLVPGRLERPGADRGRARPARTRSRRCRRRARCSARARSSSPTRPSRSPIWRCAPRASTATSRAGSARRAARGRTGR